MLDCGKPVMEQPFNYFTGKILCNEPLWLGVRKERLKPLKGKHNTNGNEAKTSDNQPETTEKLPKYESQCLILL
jgi:hypothetical protein